jgi:hypothetical protein
MTYTRDDWKQTRKALLALKQRREDMVLDIKTAFEQERDRRWAKTQARYQNLRAKFDEIEVEIGEPLGFCEGCDEPIFVGEAYHTGEDVCLCANCAPSYADMAASPQNFRGANDEPMTKQEAETILQAHVSAGGSPDDKMVSP